MIVNDWRLIFYKSAAFFVWACVATKIGSATCSRCSDGFCLISIGLVADNAPCHGLYLASLGCARIVLLFFQIV